MKGKNRKINLNFSLIMKMSEGDGSEVKDICPSERLTFLKNQSIDLLNLSGYAAPQL